MVTLEDSMPATAKSGSGVLQPPARPATPPKAAPAKAAAPEPPAAPPRPLPAAAAARKTAPEPAPTPAKGPVLAAPATRKLAREHGIDIRLVKGTGPGGRITQEDVLSFVSSPTRRAGAPAEEMVQAGGPSESPLAFPRPMLPDFSQWGEVDRQKASPIRKRIVQRMTLASQITAAVTHMDEADITMLEENRLNARKAAEEKGVKLTLLPYILKAVATALQRHTVFNSSFDDDKQEIVVKKYFHIGIAVDSPQGLLVPVVRDVNKKTVAELARDIVDLAERARTGKITADQMRGGSFTITNIGAIGGTGFTPIINWPEVAILGLGRTQERPALQNGVLVNRKKLPLALTFDHRVTDGAQAARFVNDIKQFLENPLLLLLES
jgi:pyruvate dehydrogenase E2 component (dihydrolipoamide acetyltransferase)